MLIGGIDEAGRGPVMGPMVMAIASIRKSDEFKLQTLGVKDSKLLTEAKRRELFKVIKELCRTAVIKVYPEEIDEAVNSTLDNLNWLEARTTAKLINKVACNKVFLDCPSSNLDSYGEYIKNLLKNKKTSLVVEHKADLNYLIVAAASIIAKVTRDEEIEKIKKELKKDFGSGYSSDPKTQDFVRKNWNKKKHSKYMRKSWDTWKKHRYQKAQKSLGEF